MGNERGNTACVPSLSSRVARLVTLSLDLVTFGRRLWHFFHLWLVTFLVTFFKSSDFSSDIPFRKKSEGNSLFLPLFFQKCVNFSALSGLKVNQYYKFLLPVQKFLPHFLSKLLHKRHPSIFVANALAPHSGEKSWPFRSAKLCPHSWTINLTVCTFLFNFVQSMTMWSKLSRINQPIHSSALLC